jgi:hypothetical protein
VVQSTTAFEVSAGKALVFAYDRGPVRMAELDKTARLDIARYRSRRALAVLASKKPSEYRSRLFEASLPVLHGRSVLMARRSPQSALKRAREQALREKREQKQAKKDARAADRAVADDARDDGRSMTDA